MRINWYPGHMKRSLDKMKEALPRVDFVVEILDARVPKSSRNPEIIDLTAHKDRLILLNKADLADPGVTSAWIEDFQKLNVVALESDLHVKRTAEEVRRKIIWLNQEKILRAKAKGYKNRPLRLMICGIPNTGKSTLINRLAGKTSMKVQNRPGITRSLSWLRVGREFELLDTPGILMPRLETLDEQCAIGATGAIPDDLLPLDVVAFWLLRRLEKDYPGLFSERYKVTVSCADLADPVAAAAIMDEAANCRGLLSGGKADLDRFYSMFIDDFRRGKLGRISLESPGAES
jgi:ribosome biogenesis GTPase A